LVEDGFHHMFKKNRIFYLALEANVVDGFWNMFVTAEWIGLEECLDEGLLAYFRSEIMETVGVLIMKLNKFS
jgi:hypothetical protein